MIKGFQVGTFTSGGQGSFTFPQPFPENSNIAVFGSIRWKPMDRVATVTFYDVTHRGASFTTYFVGNGGLGGGFSGSGGLPVDWIAIAY